MGMSIAVEPITAIALEGILPTRGLRCCISSACWVLPPRPLGPSISGQGSICPSAWNPGTSPLASLSFLCVTDLYRLPLMLCGVLCLCLFCCRFMGLLGPVDLMCSSHLKIFVHYVIKHSGSCSLRGAAPVAAEAAEALVMVPFWSVALLVRMFAVFTVTTLSSAVSGLL